MRTAFIQQLIEEARNDKRIFLITGDLGFSVLEPFANEFPERYLNIGVAEQNMTGVAAGLAKEGYSVYTYSIGNFPTLRCMEQIRYDVCYHRLNVKIIAVGGGYAYGSLGPSHHATEELGMLRIIPNLVVCAPGDPNEARAVASFTANYNGPVYIRIGKAGEPYVHTTIPSIRLGDILPIIKGKKIAVLSTGAMLKYAEDFLKKSKSNASLYSCLFVKPINEEQLLKICKGYDKIITIEEHQRCGGFGSAILEQVNDFQEKGLISEFPRVKRIAIADEFFSFSGSQQYIRESVGIKLEESFFKL